MEKKFKRLLVFGDSYCAESVKFCEKHKGPESAFAFKKYVKEQYNDNPSWMDTLSDHLGVTVDHVGTAGTGPSDVVWQLTNFLADNKISNEDIIIICWSQYNRSLDKNNKPIRFPEEYLEQDARLAGAVKLYFNFIYNDDERLNVYNASVLAVDKLLEAFRGPLFHFFCFHTEYSRFQHRSDKSLIKKTYFPVTGNLCTSFYLSELAERHYRTHKDDNSFWKAYPNHLGPLANQDLINYIKVRL